MASEMDRFYEGIAGANKLYGDQYGQQKDLEAKRLAAEKDAQLRQLLQAQGAQENLAAITAKGNSDVDVEKRKSDNNLDLARKAATDPTLAAATKNRNIAASGSGGITITGKEPNPLAGMRAQAMDDAQRNKYSTALGKLSGFGQAIKEADDITNRDGKGGVLSNPDAKFLSTGKFQSAVPDAGMGLAELVGAVPKGAAEERKALARLNLEYQKSMSGLRISDAARKAERDAQGWIASGDPDLVAKGVRALARNHRQALMTAQGGFRPEIRDQVHQVSGDPSEVYQNMYQDKPTAQHTPANPVSAPSAAPAAGEDAERAEYEALKAKHRPGGR